MNKRHSIQSVLVIFAFIAWGHNSYGGGGWTQKKRAGFFKLGQYILRSDRYFNPEGDLIDINPGIALYTTSLYAEYGITDRLTGIVYFPFFSRSVLNELQKRNGDIEEGDELNSLGDTNLSLKYGLIRDRPFVLSAMLTLGLPLGDEKGGRTGVLQTGDGEFNQLLSLEAGWSLYPIPAYMSASVGFNKRSMGFSDEARFGFEAGYTLGNFTAIARFAGVESLMNGETNPNEVQGVFGNNIEYISFSPELVYEIQEKFGVSVSVGTAFSGQQVLANPSIEAGFSWKVN